MDDNTVEFLLNAQDLVRQFETLIDKHDMRDRVISSMMIGVIQDDEEEDVEDDEEMINIKSIYNFNVADTNELDLVLSFMKQVYDQNSDNGLSDLLNGTGISLN